MTISNASEIHFWPAGTYTFNNEQKAYTQEDVHYYQRFLSSSNRRLQGVDEDGVVREYTLKGYNEDGEEVLSLPYISYQEYPGNSEDIFDGFALDTWTNEDVFGANSWTPGSSPVATTGLSATYTDKLVSPINVRKQSLTLQMQALVQLAPGRLKVEFFKNGVSVGSGESAEISVGAIFQSFEVAVTLTDDADQIKVQWGRTTGSSSRVYLATPSCIVEAVDPTIVVYEVSFVPQEEEIEDECVKFKIINEDEEIEHESDLVEFTSAWETSPRSGRVNIQFRSQNNFEGLIYQYDETLKYFNIEVEGKFLKERYPSTVKTIELTSKILNTASAVKTQRRLIIDHVPDYMHKKITLALAHAGGGEVIIDGKSWSVEEAYEQGEVPEDCPISPATIYLTEKNTYYQNVI